jgi:hypothetical protein
MADNTWALKSGKFPLVSFSLIGVARREGTVLVVVVIPSPEKNWRLDV